MQANELKALATYLTDLETATRAGKVNWTRSNETTFVWNVSATRAARLVIQKSSNTAGASSYLFQAYDDSKKCDTEIRSESANPPVHQALSSLFSTIESLRDQKSLDFLKSILPQ